MAVPIGYISIDRISPYSNSATTDKMHIPAQTYSFECFITAVSLYESLGFHTMHRFFAGYWRA